MQHRRGRREPTVLPSQFDPYPSKIKLIRRALSSKRRRLLVLVAVWMLYKGVISTQLHRAWFYMVVYSRQRASASRRSTRRPVPDFRVSVILMNYQRPRMLQSSNLLPTLTKHKQVDEIVLCHAQNRTRFSYPHSKVKNVDATAANQQWGLALRLHYCAQAKNNHVVLVDDDQELTSDALDKLFDEFQTDPRRIVGRYGRGFTEFSGYRTTDLLGRVEVVLTKLLVLEKQVCQTFIQYQSVVEDLVQFSTPLWNGEDIFVNLVANHFYNVPYNRYNNYAMKLNVWEADDSLKDDNGSGDISGNANRHSLWQDGFFEYWRYRQKQKAHLDYRSHLWKVARQRLADIRDV